MNKLVNNLIKNGYLKSDLVIEAFSEISRIEFVSEDLELEAEKDVPLPIGCGQTISQPSVVAFMLELLDVQAGQKILDIGSGSGWTAALLAYIVGLKGKVITVEVVDELKKSGEINVEKYGFIKEGVVEFYSADGQNGFPDKAPYDRILASACWEDVPQALKDQLKIGGKMVIPIRNSIIYIEKKSETEFYKEEFPGFNFVPLITR